MRAFPIAQYLFESQSECVYNHQKFNFRNGNLNP